jgi:hypothetical protein
MDRLDRMIAEALDDEDRALLDSIEEPGFFALGLGQFRGKLGWVTWVLMAGADRDVPGRGLVRLAFLHRHRASAGAEMGADGGCSCVLATQLKMALVPQMQADRVLRALRRVELMVLQARKRD